MGAGRAMVGGGQGETVQPAQQSSHTMFGGDMMRALQQQTMQQPAIQPTPQPMPRRLTIQNTGMPPGGMSPPSHPHIGRGMRRS